MARIFAVTIVRGPRWNEPRAMEEQEDWRPHADFMNALKAEGFVVLGGPLEGTRQVLLILRSEGPEQIRTRLAEDPWHQHGLLQIVQIVPWQLRLGSLP
jgi:uncharacterized protein YciI